MIAKQIKNLCSEKGISRTWDKLIFWVKKNDYIKKESEGNGGNQEFAHVTYCVAPNAGDTVLSQCVRRTFQTNLKISNWRIIPVNNEVSIENIKAINKCGMLVIGGGGLFLPDTNKNSISGWQWAISKKLLNEINVPISVYSVGYNYFKGQENDSLFIDSLCALTEKSAFLGLRNRGSIKAVRNLLPKKLSTKIVFQPCTTTLIRKLYKDSIPAKKETGSIAINMAFDRENLRFGDNKEAILKQVAEAVSKIEKKGYKIFYVCHCWNDDKFLPYLREKEIKYEFVDLSRKYPHDIYKFYNEIDLVLGMRGHAQMIPFGLNCEIISLGTHNKMRWFLDDIEANNWYVDISDDITTISDRILSTFCNIHMTEHETTKKRLLDEQENMWNITMNNLRIIGGLGINY